MTVALDTFTLKNGVTMPCLGFGTYNTSDEDARRVVLDALQVGYRLIDTAAIYENEAGIGKALAEGGVAREELFVTSKVWNTHRGYDKTMESFNASMERLGLEYLDLFLIHWPANEKQFGNQTELINADTWRALEDLYNAGKVRAIGLSNFKPHHIEGLMKHATIEPVVNQIEFYPGRMQEETLQYCLDRGMIVEAWSPLGRGKTLTNEAIAEIGARYGKSNAQVCLRWLIQLGMLPLPKSGNPERMKQNLEVFDFELTAEEMAIIAAQENPTGRFWDPDEIDF
jgi:hypothetical protein